MEGYAMEVNERRREEMNRKKTMSRQEQCGVYRDESVRKE
jgi:hypothetical protein